MIASFFNNHQSSLADATTCTTICPSMFEKKKSSHSYHPLLSKHPYTYTMHMLKHTQAQMCTHITHTAHRDQGDPFNSLVRLVPQRRSQATSHMGYSGLDRIMLHIRGQRIKIRHSLIHPVQTGIDRSCRVKSQVSVHTTQSSQTLCISVVIAIKKCENVTALDWCLVKLDQNVPPESKLFELVQKIGLLLSLDERHHVVPDKIV